MPARRVLVLDEPLDRRLASELRARGRECVSVYELGLSGVTDAELLEGVAERTGRSWVLVTVDDSLPAIQDRLRRRLRATLAIVDPMSAGSQAAGAGERELVHRWAHAMQRQSPASVRRYGARGGRRWRERRRPGRLT